jgi:N-acetylmuramoyl-L-alanine amidase
LVDGVSRNPPAPVVDYMTRLLRGASAAALLITAGLVVGTTVPGFAQATVASRSASAAPVQPAEMVSVEVVQPLPAPTVVATIEPASPQPAEVIAVPRNAGSLRAMVAATPHHEPEDAQLRCLAAGVFFESNGESLDGQLAVAHVIINRTHSGRFASTPCAVLTQRGQFSFVRGGVVPQPAASTGWRTAVAIARIAQQQSWANPAPGALFFHAARISPGWNRPRIARIDNHVFYR